MFTGKIDLLHLIWTLQSKDSFCEEIPEPFNKQSVNSTFIDFYISDSSEETDKVLRKESC